MNRPVIVAAAVLCAVALSASASADTLVLSNGSRLQGTMVAFSAGTLTFRSNGEKARRYRISEVVAVEFPSSERARRSPANDRTDRDNRTEQSDRDLRALEAPAGTQIIVRTVSAIDSRKAGADETFSAVVEQAVTNAAGRVIVPEGSGAQLIIRRSSSGGATSGAEMVLDVESLTIDGRRYWVSTTDLTQESDTGIGSNRRTATTIGGGAVLGTIIGAIAGGGKGAAIGGAVGAAGGAGVQVLTKGRDVRVPAETLLTFRLDERMVLRSTR